MFHIFFDTGTVIRHIRQYITTIIISVGGAAVSEKHAGFVVNLGGATEQDVLDTMDLVRRTVLEQSGISLEPEVRLWRMEEEE